VAGYKPRWFTRPRTVTHPSTNRARRGVTSLIETNALPLSHAATSLRVQVLACVAETRRLGALLSERSALVLSSPTLSSLVAVDVRTSSVSTPSGAPLHPGLDASPAAANAASPALRFLQSPGHWHARTSWSIGSVVVVFIIVASRVRP